MEKTKYFELVKGAKIAPNATASKLVKTESCSALDLAVSVKKTKAYAENAELKKATDEIIAGGATETVAPKPEQQPTRSGRPGEPRRW